MKPIGLIIKEELQRQERTVAWFARKLSCDRSNVYRLFNKHSIETDLLIRISAILNRDFTSEISSIIQARLQSQNRQHS
ncbi:MAG: XRE family transcriptional regulator [Muribaculaceae bacterium]|nr:XRE family transcriptional regulator [Muribaculaceae bacterium]